jgi:hypothetical protein
LRKVSACLRGSNATLFRLAKIILEVLDDGVLRIYMLDASIFASFYDFFYWILECSNSVIFWGLFFFHYKRKIKT